VQENEIIICPNTANLLNSIQNSAVKSLVEVENGFMKIGEVAGLDEQMIQYLQTQEAEEEEQERLERRRRR